MGAFLQLFCGVRFLRCTNLVHFCLNFLHFAQLSCSGYLYLNGIPAGASSQSLLLLFPRPVRNHHPTPGEFCPALRGRGYLLTIPQQTKRALVYNLGSFLLFYAAVFLSLDIPAGGWFFYSPESAKHPHRFVCGFSNKIIPVTGSYYLRMRIA